MNTAFTCTIQTWLLCDSISSHCCWWSPCCILTVCQVRPVSCHPMQSNSLLSPRSASTSSYSLGSSISGIKITGRHLSTAGSHRQPGSCRCRGEAGRCCWSCCWAACCGLMSPGVRHHPVCAITWGHNAVRSVEKSWGRFCFCMNGVGMEQTYWYMLTRPWQHAA